MGLILENITFKYKQKPVLNELSLSIETGESVGIIGVSGCGKSTLLKIISGLYLPQSGRIEVENETIPSEIMKKSAVVMQNPMLFPSTIKENITCGHDIDEHTMKKACEAAQLSEWIAALPDGIDTFVGERGGKVSGGQAQRIAIARAIAKNAPVVLLDEVTSALDNETSGVVLSALKNLMIGKTVIHVSHRPELLEGCTRILLMEGGKLYDNFHKGNA